MATTQLIETQLRLILDDGVNEEGKPVYKNKNFNNVNIAATPDQLLQAAQAIAGLQEKPLVTVERNDSSQIMN